MVLIMSMLSFLISIIFIAVFIILYFSESIYLFYFVVFLNFLIIFIKFILFSLEVSWFKNTQNKDYYKKMIINIIFLSILLVFIYSFIYYKFSFFIINWIETKISFQQSLYLSLSMRSNLGYSFIIPKDEISIITSLEAINWYFVFAFLVACIMQLFSNIWKNSDEYLTNLVTKKWKKLKNKKSN